MRVIGFSGAMFAGKTTAARYLESRGYAYTRISEVIDDVLRERGEAISRENQQRVGLELHTEKGQSWLCGQAIDRLQGAPQEIVVDGLRWPEDAAFFRARFGERFLHIDIFTPSELRRERAARSGRGVEFDRAENHPVERGVDAVGDLADVMLSNDSDIAMLEQRLSEIIKKGSENAS